MLRILKICHLTTNKVSSKELAFLFDFSFFIEYNIDIQKEKNMNNESKGLLNKVKPSMDMVLTGLATSTIIGGIIFSNIELSTLGMSVLIWVQLDKLSRKLSEQK